MSARDARYEFIDDVPRIQVGDGWNFQRIGLDEAAEIADELIALGYRKHTVMTTAEELDALPYGAVVLDKYGKAWMWVEDEDTSHWAAHDDFLYKAESLLSFYGPVTVLHVGGAE